MNMKGAFKHFSAAAVVAFSVLLSGVPALAGATERISVVASFSILGDVTREIGGDAVEVRTLVGADEDAHIFTPTPDDARTLMSARIVIKNGLGFEPWLDRLLKSTETSAMIVSVGDVVVPIQLAGEHGVEVDPHAWQDLSNVRRYVDQIRDALIQALPDQRSLFATNAQRYRLAVDVAEQELKKCLAPVPLAHRKIVTSHDAFGYFGRAYQIAFLAPQGISTETQPTAEAVAGLIDQIRDEKISAVFVENIRDSRLLKQIADETGASMGGTLYSDALSAEGAARTFLGLFQHNASTICSALSKK